MKKIDNLENVSGGICNKPGPLKKYGGPRIDRPPEIGPPPLKPPVTGPVVPLYGMPEPGLERPVDPVREKDPYSTPPFIPSKEDDK